MEYLIQQDNTTQKLGSVCVAPAIKYANPVTLSLQTLQQQSVHLQYTYFLNKKEKKIRK